MEEMSRVLNNNQKRNQKMKDLNGEIKQCCAMSFYGHFLLLLHKYFCHFQPKPFFFVSLFQMHLMKHPPQTKVLKTPRLLTLLS